jgi:hypothetical protein
VLPLVGEFLAKPPGRTPHRKPSGGGKYGTHS